MCELRHLLVMALQVREADISRLSFAVEIAEEFYGRFVCLFVFSFAVCSFLITNNFPENFDVHHGEQSEGNVPSPWIYVDN